MALEQVFSFSFWDGMLLMVLNGTFTGIGTAIGTYFVTKRLLRRRR